MLSANTEKLFWGYGLTHNFEVFKRYMLVYNPFDEASITQTINNPHNSFISIILMFGLYFFFALTSFVIIILAKFLKTYIFNKHIANKNQYIIILSAFTSLLAMGLFEGQLVQPEFFNIQPCLFFMGIMYYLNKFKRSYSLN
jgi:hypothetical protein